MATPKIVTDSSSDLDEAVLNLFLNAGKLQVKINWCQIKFEAAGNTPTVVAAMDSDGEIVTGDLAWAATQITVTLSGFSNVPIGFATLSQNLSTNIGAVLFRPVNATTCYVRFIGTGAGETGVDPDNDIYVNVMIIGA